jgi:HAD superfamily hydrolase (TIGR01662 family)
MPKTAINTVCFDLGNTLVYYDSSWPGSLDEVLDPLVKSLGDSGLRFNESQLREQVTSKIVMCEPQAEDGYLEVTAHQALLQILRDITRTEVAENIIHSALRAMYQVAEIHWKPEPEAIGVLQQFQANGYKIGIISNAADHENMERILENSGFYPYLNCKVSSAQFGYGKPKPDIFQHALKILQATPESAVMIGDKLEADIQGANQVGMRSIWITRRVKNAKTAIENPLMQPWKVVSNLNEIPPLLEFT